MRRRLVALATLVATAPLAKGGEAQGQARAPTAQLVLEVEPTTLVLGQGQGAEVEARPREGQAAGPPRWTASIGAVSDGVYDPGERRAPAVAVIAGAVPLDGGGEARGAVRVVLNGAGNLMTQTSPGARVTVEIAGRRFGPVTADARGQAPVPVEVPPDARQAKVHAVDVRGLPSTLSIDLPTPAFPAGVVLAPERLWVGALGTITIFAVGPDGAWRGEGDGPPEVRVDPTRLRVAGPPRATAPGRWDVTVEAIATAPDGTLVAAAFGETPVVEATLAIEPKPDDVGAGGGGGEPVSSPVVARHARPAAGVRLGAASALGPLASLVAHGDLAWPLLDDDVLVSVVGELGVAHGTASEFHGLPTDATMTQLHLGIAGRVRFPLTPRLALDGAVGIGFGLARSRIADQGQPVRVESASSPFGWASLALVLAARGGEALIDLRWVELRFDETTKIQGNAVGFALTAGWRFTL